jgi:hypothetical protein
MRPSTPASSWVLLSLLLPGVVTSGASGARSQGNPPVLFQTRVDGNGSGQATLTNRGTNALTAYLLDVRLEPCNPLQPASVLRPIDALASPDGTPVGPGASRTDDLGVSRCNKDGVSTPNRAELKALIFADGSTSGDPASIAAILDQRRVILGQCDAVLARLRAPNAASATPQALAADLRARVRPAIDPSAAPATVDPVTIAERTLTAPATSSNEAVARTIALFDRWRQALIDSKPDIRSGRR